MAEENEDKSQEECKQKKCECEAGAPFWMVTYSDLVTLLRGGEVLVENARHASSFQECVSTQGQAIYRLEVRNSGGYFNFLELHVTVL